MNRQLAEVTEKYAQLVTIGEPKAMAELGRKDLFFLLVCLMRRHDLRHQWLLDRCDEVQCDPDGYLDLWAREHGKSSIITVGRTIQDVLNDPEVTVGIFSHTRPNAKAFLRQIKREFEQNALLQDLYPDVLWSDPNKEAPTWSEDSGIVVKRKSNPKESTVEAWGLVDGQPIGKHFDVLVYDDLVTRENAASPDMREKTLDAWSLSLNLGKRGGRRRMIGTRYHYADAYAEVMRREAATPRVYPCEIRGKPVLMTKQELDEKRRDQGSVVFAAQMMLDPKPQDGSGFQREHLRTYHSNVVGNTYIVVDPANSKRKKSDYTALWVITLGDDGNYYVRWMTRDRLNLEERIQLVIWAHREHRPMRVGYEQYGMSADIQALRMEQNRIGYRFDVVELGGQLAKSERIAQLIPVVEQGKLYLPGSLWIETKDRPERHDIVRAFTEDEFLAWPYGAHDDMLDSLARILDPAMGAIWPKQRERPRAMTHRRVERGQLAWVA